jgi:hypothetical protein
MSLWRIVVEFGVAAPNLESRGKLVSRLLSLGLLWLGFAAH